MATRDTLDEIYERLNTVETLRELGLDPKPTQTSISVICPSCGKHEAYIYKGGHKIICNRQKNCGKSISLWDIVQQRGRLTNQETLIALAKTAGYPLPETEYDEAKYKAEKAKEGVLENALTLFKDTLFDKRGEKVLAYLKGRGYTEDEIRGTDLGFIPPQAELRKRLKGAGYDEETISGSGLLSADYGDIYTLAIPYRNSTGRLQGFVVRDIDFGEREKKAKGWKLPKYKVSAGLERGNMFFNMDKNIRRSKLTVVEGYIDALIATYRGLEGIVAAGGSGATESQIDHAIKSGATSFILALDADDAGEKGTHGALRLLWKKRVNGYVITYPAGVKIPGTEKDVHDPDELMRAKGVDAFRDCIATAEAGSTWAIKSILSKHSIQSKQLTDQETDEIIHEAIRLSETISDPLDGKRIMGTLSESLSIPLEVLAPKFDDYKSITAREKQKRGYEELNSQASRLVSEGDLPGLDKLYRGKLQSIRELGIVRNIYPYALETFTDDTIQKKPGLKTGFTELDKMGIRIPQEAVTIIAGRPSHGKTTFLLNLSLNMVEEYPDRRFFFITYEETAQRLTSKYLKIISEAKKENIEEYVRTHRNDVPAIEKAKNTYKEYADSGRLWIIDEPYYVDELTDTMDYLRGKYENIGAIFIDYIQKVKIKDSYSTRQTELQKISADILEAAKRNRIPIILGAQFNREVERPQDMSLLSIREAGDIEQDANTLLGLFHMDKAFKDDKAKNKVADTGNTCEENTAGLKVKILKNRDGVSDGEVTLRLDRPILKILKGDKPAPFTMAIDR